MFKSYKLQLKRNGINDSASVKAFLLRHHYLKSLPRGINRTYILSVKGVIKGIALFGYPVGKMSNRITELKRFCLSEDCPKNTASWFMSKCMKHLKLDKTIDTVISYADPTQGHQGTIYKASNFVYSGKQVQGTPYFRIKGQKVYYRNLMHYDKYKGYASMYKSGILKMSRMRPKHVFKYELRK